MAENENLASILVKSGLISIFTNSPIGYFSKFANDLTIQNGPWRRVSVVSKDSFVASLIAFFLKIIF